MYGDLCSVRTVCCAVERLRPRNGSHSHDGGSSSSNAGEMKKKRKKINDNDMVDDEDGYTRHAMI